MFCDEGDRAGGIPRLRSFLSTMSESALGDKENYFLGGRHDFFLGDHGFA